MKIGSCGVGEWIGSIALVVGICLAMPGAVRLHRRRRHPPLAPWLRRTRNQRKTSPPFPGRASAFIENRKLQDVTGWVPLRGERSGLQLVVLLDDSSRGNLGLQLNDIRSFVTGLPPTHAGSDRLYAQRDAEPGAELHQRPRRRRPSPSACPGTAGGNGSPYFCLSDLVKHWPGGDSNVRREVIMVTDGVDRYSGGRFDPDNPYVQAATSDAQKAGVIVYSIYYRGAGRFDRSALVTDGGQNYLTQVSGDTGGKVYLEGFGNPVSFAPFLSDIQRKLQNQYELSFVSTAKPGLQSIRVKTNQPNTTCSGRREFQLAA